MYERARHDDAHNFGSSTTCCGHVSAKDTSIIRCAARATAELVASYCCKYMSLNDSLPEPAYAIFDISGCSCTGITTSRAAALFVVLL